ncbi:hypothetical protein M527_08180 [Sphingobium indicum IP26]|nr:hypothetical protein M527_08180 [Sphingobium indicum IP26]EQB06997.1 hypothetical protein L286_05155 [Sphingobium sp. HDIP04]
MQAENPPMPNRKERMVADERYRLDSLLKQFRV